MSRQRRRNPRPEKHYSVRAIHRPTPDVQRLTELVIRLAIQRRELVKDEKPGDDADTSQTRRIA